jgi:GNAT superfamily N-acetyltransferase
VQIMQITDRNPQGLLPQWSAKLETRGGLKLNVRSAAQDDEPELIRMLGKASPEDLRFRFLSTVGQVGHSLAQPLVDVDHERTENLLAFDDEDGSLVATAMIAADDQLEDAEVAVFVRPDMKGRGAGWSMLALSCDYARQRGFQRLHSVELGENRRAIALEKEMGFIASPCPGDATLTILSKNLTAG